MYGAAVHSLADRFTWLIDGLCKVIGADAHKRRMEGALAWAIWSRVRLLGERLIALAARVRAGRIPGKRTPHPNPLPQGGRERQPAGGQHAQRVLPREFGWVTRALPATLQYAGALVFLLRDPETAVLVEQAPQAGRILRRLCHLLGVNAPEFLRRCGRAMAAEELAAPLAAEERPEPLPLAGPLDPPETPPAMPPPSPSPPTVQAATPPPRPHHLRPGGLYWNGRGLEWS